MSAPAPAQRKILVVVVDGLGDLPVDVLGGDTPLEAARTPVMDAWVAAGQCGLVDPLEPGRVVETHAGTGALFGLSAEAVAGLARGPIEAAGAGLDLVAGDVALRCNFATVVEQAGDLAIRDRRAGRIREGMDDLAAAVNGIAPQDGVTTFLQPLSQHRAVLRLSGPDLSDGISDTDPGVGSDPQTLRWSRALRADDARAEHTAAALNAFLRRAHQVLALHPVNRERARLGLPAASGLLTRGAGFVHALESTVVRLGLRGAVVAADRTVLGLGALLGFTPVVEAPFTGLLDTDLDAKVAAARAALADHDIVWMHAKGSDVAAHDRRPRAKRDFIERLDAALAALIGEDLVVAVTADHTTDSNTGRHTSDPVPTLLHLSGGRRDDVTVFGERACMRGGLGRLRASDLVRMLIAAAHPQTSPEVAQGPATPGAHEPEPEPEPEPEAEPESGRS